MQLYRYENPFIRDFVPNNIFRISIIQARNTVLYKGVEYHINDSIALNEQTRKANIIKIIGIYTVFCWFYGNDSAKCRIEVMRSESTNNKIYTKMYIDANRNYVHPISVIENIASSNLVDNLNEL